MENLTGERVGIFRDDKGGQDTGTDFPAEGGIRREHSICQQLGVAEHVNRSTSEGIAVPLSQSGLAEWIGSTGTCTCERTNVLRSPPTPLSASPGRQPS